MEIHEIFGHISVWCDVNNTPISMKRRKRMAEVIRERVVAEHERLHEMRSITSDDAVVLTHSDPTGEQAVNNVMRAIMTV